MIFDVVLWRLCLVYEHHLCGMIDGYLSHHLAAYRASRTCDEHLAAAEQLAHTVRAIVRGKAKARTEFGAKIGASIVEGYTFIDHHSWDAYNESQDLLLQIQLFKELFCYLKR